MAANDYGPAFSEMDRISKFCFRWHIQSYDAFLKKAGTGMPDAIEYVRSDPEHEASIRRMLSSQAETELRARKEAQAEKRRRAEIYGRTSDGETVDAGFWLSIGVPVDADGSPLGIGDGY